MVSGASLLQVILLFLTDTDTDTDTDHRSNSNFNYTHDVFEYSFNLQIANQICWDGFFDTVFRIGSLGHTEWKTTKEKSGSQDLFLVFFIRFANRFLGCLGESNKVRGEGELCFVSWHGQLISYMNDSFVVIQIIVEWLMTELLERNC